MTAITPSEHGAVRETDTSCNTSANPSFSDIVDARLSRRNMLRVGLGTAGAAVLAACGGGSDAAPAPIPAGPNVAAPVPTPVNLSFSPVAKSRLDQVTVPTGYTARPVYALGDPLTAATPDFRNDGTDADFDNRAGDHHDGVEYYGLNAAGTARDPAGSERGLLAVNHEALTVAYLHPNGATGNPRPAAEAAKEIAAHGISVVELRKANGTWSYQRSSAYNRRVTPLTPVTISGPARGHALMKTLYSPTGTDGRGTLGNCGTGTTPWGTFLTAEENFAGFFRRAAGDNAARTAKEVVSFNRYNRAEGSNANRGWNTSGAADAPRWDVSKVGASVDGTDDFRNEMNTFGWMVEIDPYDKAAPVRKRTALGRYAHESATFGKLVEGKPVVVYMGDDQAADYIYKYVSNAAWAAADASAANRIGMGDKYLDAGRLYVARFDATGNGQWIELSITNPQIANYAPYDFADQGDVVVNARIAADAVGATKMDRPEWCAVHPVTGEVYYTLTNNSGRKIAPTGTQQGVDSANPRSYSDTFAGGAPKAVQNVHGHVIRMKEAANDGSATTFTWDVYLFGAEAGADTAKVNLSALTADQDFSSPDGLWFSQKTGLLFIQTDDSNYTDVTNCMMLVGKPGQVGDGAPVTVSYDAGGGNTVNVQTYVGAKPTADTLRRFLVGPVDCEITGIAETPDGKTLFVNVQHPGDTIGNIADPSTYSSHWPANAGYGGGGATTARPRSATVAITRNDGGVIGTDGTALLNDF
ncbi:MAG TPA: PhoX family phosphatase [Ramlibacter sp.]|nr:PhoX family phosphatase [Ramlibacter sp.]